jgi:hypothetical protein
MVVTTNVVCPEWVTVCAGDEKVDDRTPRSAGARCDASHDERQEPPHADSVARRRAGCAATPTGPAVSSHVAVARRSDSRRGCQAALSSDCPAGAVCVGVAARPGGGGNRLLRRGGATGRSTGTSTCYGRRAARTTGGPRQNGLIPLGLVPVVRQAVTISRGASPGASACRSSAGVAPTTANLAHATKMPAMIR